MKKARTFKALAYAFVIFAVILAIAAIAVLIGDGNGFLDLSDFVAKITFGGAAIFAILAATFYLLYKSNKQE